MATDTQFGVDPSGQPQPMPNVDPNSPPPDPMLAPPGAGDIHAEDLAEFQTRERVELQLLLAIEKCAHATMVGLGAENGQFMTEAAQSCQYLGIAYQALAQIELKENAPPPAPSPFGQPPQGGPSPMQVGGA